MCIIMKIVVNFKSTIQNLSSIIIVFLNKSLNIYKDTVIQMMKIVEPQLNVRSFDVNYAHLNLSNEKQNKLVFSCVNNNGTSLINTYK